MNTAVCATPSRIDSFVRSFARWSYQHKKPNLSSSRYMALIWKKKWQEEEEEKEEEEEEEEEGR